MSGQRLEAPAPEENVDSGSLSWQLPLLVAAGAGLFVVSLYCAQPMPRHHGHRHRRFRLRRGICLIPTQLGCALSISLLAPLTAVIGERSSSLQPPLGVPRCRWAASHRGIALLLVVNLAVSCGKQGAGHSSGSGDTRAGTARRQGGEAGSDAGLCRKGIELPCSGRSGLTGSLRRRYTLRSCRQQLERPAVHSQVID